jgi:heme A synthase
VIQAPELRWLSAIAAALFLAQVAIGAATVFLKFPAEWRALHLSLGTLLWGTMVALAALSLVRPRIHREEVAHA